MDLSTMIIGKHKHGTHRKPRNYHRMLSIATLFVGVFFLSLGISNAYNDKPPAPTTKELSGTTMMQQAVPTVPAEVVKKAKIREIKTEKKYVTKKVDVLVKPEPKAKRVTEVKRGKTVKVTGKKEEGLAEIVYEEELLWVKAKYLSDDKPKNPPAAPKGLSYAPCPSGSGMESGVQPDTIRVHRAVCAVFPSITVYGGLGNRGEHATGRAIDIMVSGATGHEVAAFLQKNWKALGVSQLIYQQKIWTVERSAEGWRGMEDRGSVTQNHFDHVHATTFGNRGTTGNAAPAAPAVANGVWDKIAQCESGGNWHINTGNGYYGGLQFSAATWRSVGGPGLPHEQSREVQIKYAEILQKRSGWGQWSCAGARFN